MSRCLGTLGRLPELTGLSRVLFYAFGINCVQI